MKKTREARPIAGLAFSLVCGILAFLNIMLVLRALAPLEFGIGLLASIMTILGGFVGYLGKLKLGGVLVIIFALVFLFIPGYLALFSFFLGLIAGCSILSGW